MDYTDISEETLILRLKSTEHDFVERKSKSDKGGWLETAVAFANSAPLGWPAILFVGADNDGTTQIDQDDLENQVRSISGVLDRAYPAIYRFLKPVRSGGKACIAVIVPGSAERPHFTGKSFVRVGDSTKEASEAQYSELIAQRNSKVREILASKGKHVTLATHRISGTNIHQTHATYCEVADCNQFFVTLRRGNQETDSISLPLSRLELAHDHKNNWLKLIVEED